MLSQHPTLPPIVEFSKNASLPPPCFAMCVLIKDLQRSVVQVCANKGLSSESAAAIPISHGSPCSIVSGFLCELCVSAFNYLIFSPLFSNPKKCIIMHFSPKSVPNMHYNALFKTPLSPPHPTASSQSLLYVLNDGGLSVGDALHYVGKRLDHFRALVH
jgi:hypothetical protein